MLFNYDHSVGEWVGAIVPFVQGLPAASSFPTDTLYTGSG